MSNIKKSKTFFFFKLNSHNENQYENLVDKTIICNLEPRKKMELLKNNYFQKWKCSIYLFRYNTQKDNKIIENA